MNPRPHSDTQARLEGFEARLQDAFAWANDHAREIVTVAGVLLLVGAIATAVWEYRRRSAAAAETELAHIDTTFSNAMGSAPGEYFVSEPANPEQATKAREAALVDLDAFIAKHNGSPAKVADSLGADDPRRAIALRLRAYTLDQRGQTLAAAQTYEQGAKVTGFPPRALLWIQAGDAYSRANVPDRAIAAYREALSASPELAEQEHLVQRIGLEQAKLDAAPAAPPAPAPAPAQP